MRFAALDLLAFGPFTGRRLELDSATPALHVIFGENEAGKSTALRGLEGLLFGIPHTTVDAHVHPANRLRIGAELVAPDGRSLALVRRKGRSSTLASPDGEPIDEARLGEVLRGLTLELFRSLYGLSHETIREGGEALLSQQGHLGQSLYAASLGARGALAALDELRAQAEALFSPRARTKPLNEALKAYREAHKETRHQSLGGAAYVAQKEAIANVRKELGAATEEHARLATTLAARKRIARVAPLLTLRERYQAELARYPERDLPPDATERRLDAIRDAAEAKAGLIRNDADLGARTARQKELRPGRGIDGEELAPTIQQLSEQLGSHRKAAGDRPRLVAKVQLLEDQARKELARLTPPMDLDALEQLDLGTARTTRISQLAHDRDRHRADAIDHAEKEALLSARLARTPASAPLAESALSGLREAVDKTADAERMDRALDVAREALERAQAEQRRTLGALGKPKSDAAQLAGLTFAREDELRAAFREVAAFERKLESATDRLRTEEERASRATAELSALEATSRSPHPEDLERARTERKRALDVARDDPSAAGFAALEAAIEKVDGLTEDLLRNADQVSRRAGIQSDLQTIAIRRERAAADEAVLLSKLEATRTKIREMWPLEPPPMVLDDALRGLAEHRQLQEATASIASLTEEVTRRTAERASLYDELHRAVETATPSPSPGAASPGAASTADASLDRPAQEMPAGQRPLAPLRRRAAMILANAEAQAAAAHKEELVRAEVAQDLLRCGERKAEAERKADEAGRSFAELCAPFGLDASATSDEAGGRLAQLAEAARRLDDARAAQSRVDGIDRDHGVFLEDLRSLAADLDLTALSDDVDALAAQVLDELRERERKRDARARLRDEIEQLEKAHEENRRKADRAHAVLLDLCRSAGIDDPDKLEEAIAVGQRRRDTERQIAQLEEQILSLGDGHSIEELHRACAAWVPDKLTLAIERLEVEVDEADRARQRLAHELGGKEAGLLLMVPAEEQSEAGKRAEDAEAALCHVAELATDYMAQRFAVALLEDEIERYRQENQGPVLTRAGALFVRLTLGRYAGISVNFDDKGAPVLACRRGDEEVLPAALSDGTRDQLFLALRLAALERRIADVGPMPLILDDVLVHFDDARASAALAILGELTAKTQVLLFTHHRRVVELAEAAIGPAGVRTHDLSGNTSITAPTEVDAG